jgi:hypothetical protein
MTTASIVAVVILCIAVLCGIMSLVLYTTKTKTIVDTPPVPSPSPSPPPPQPIPPTLKTPAFKLIDTNDVVTTPCPDEPQPPPPPQPGQYPYNLLYPLTVGRFSSSDQHAFIIALGDMSTSATLYCRRVFFLMVTNKGITTHQDQEPIDFGDTPYDQIGVVDDRLNIMAINSDYAFVSALDVVLNIRVILVFERNGNVWSFKNALTSSNPIAAVPFGNTIYLKNDTLFVSNLVSFESMVVETYKLIDSDPTEWVQSNVIANNKKSASFGESIAASHTDVYISAPSQDGPFGSVSVGVVYMYKRDSDEFIPGGTLTHSDNLSNTNFGEALFVNEIGSLLVVSAPGINSVFTYYREDTENPFDKTPQQIITMPELTGGNLMNLRFGTHITGLSDGRMITITCNNVEEGYNDYNKVVIYRISTDNNLFIEYLFEPQMFGRTDMFGRFANLEISGNAKAQLLIGDIENSQIQLYESDI